MLLKNIKENFPYISIITYGGNEYVGIISNQDQNVTCFYDFNAIKTDVEKEKFSEYGEIWWWESNRTIPINIFLCNEMKAFRYALMSMNTKDVKIVSGPTVNLMKLSVRRIKRKSIMLLKSPK